MRTFDTLDTPDGPFTVVEEGGVVLAAGWTADPEALAARARVGAAGAPGRVQAADAVAEYYRGHHAAVFEVPVDTRGSEFRLRVWEELRRIPAGQRRTYGALAEGLGSPGASRAVGAACGANPVGLFVPCHRVTGASGALTGFAWGVEVKRALLEREAVAA